MSEEFKNFDELFRVDDAESEAERNARIRREAHEKTAPKTPDDGKEAKSAPRKKSGKLKSTMGGVEAKKSEKSEPAPPTSEPKSADSPKPKSGKLKSTMGKTGESAKPAAPAPAPAPKSASAPESPSARAAAAPGFRPERPSPEKPSAEKRPAEAGAKAASAKKSAAASKREKPKKAKKRDEEVVPENWTPSEPPIRPRRDGRSGCLGGLVFFAFVMSLSIILACVGWMAASDVLALNKEPLTATVTLDKSKFETREEEVKQEDGSVKTEKVRYADIDYVAGVLKDAGIIEYKGLFKLYCRFSHASSQIAPGTYELNTSFDYRALVKKMQVGTGAMVTTKVTIPEGFTMEQIFRRLEKEGICSYEDLMDAAANYKYNYSFLDENMMGDAKRLEGFLFPDTYEFYQGMQASSAINKFLVNFHNRLTKEMLDLSAQRGYTLQQSIAIASMIEKEAADDEERPIIASVIYNRLNQNMPLGIDSTIMYVLPEHGDVLTEEQTKIDSPYNTYANLGLPPTPIANPGLASINAALKPTQTNYLYYALNAETGKHEFFTNAAEFNAFVARQSYSNG